MKDKQKIINRVYELCPELKRLEFGCEVVYEGRICTYLNYIDGIADVFLDREVKEPEIVSNPEFKIIGKPITLHFLLKAIERSNNDKFKNIVINRFGQFLTPVEGRPLLKCEARWNFSIEDNLETQLENPELRSLLKEILL